MIVSCLAVCLATKVRFDQYRVYSLAVENVQQAMQLQNIESHSMGYDFWKSPAVGKDAEIMVPPHMLANFEDLVQSLNISYNLKIENVQR